MLTRLVYHSENHIGSLDGQMIRDLNAIMDVSVRNNEKAGVTGALLFDTLWFMQILEGEREAVSATLMRIVRDARHDNLVIVDARPARQRLFGNWWMGLSFLRNDQPEPFLRSGIGERFNPRIMSGEQAVGLALDLAKSGLSRRLAPQAG